MEPPSDLVINSLNLDQRKNTLFEIESEEWRKWHNIEWYERQSLGLFEMNEDQKALAFNILGASLSAKGLQKSKNIMAMEGYLKELVIKEQQIPQRRIDLLRHDKFYYRIHSPVVLIEFDHHGPTFLWDRDKPHPGPVKWHVHTVVSTPNGNDYGKDLLRQHLEKHPH